MKRIAINLVMLASCLPCLVVAAGARHSLYLDTQGRFGYSMSVTDWLDAGLAGRIHYQVLSQWRPDAGPGGSSGSVSSDAYASLLVPVIDVHPAWSGMEIGFRTYFSVNEELSLSYIEGNRIRSDIYLAYPVEFDRLVLAPTAYLLNYGYLLDEKVHQFGHGLLLEGRVAFRF